MVNDPNMKKPHAVVIPYPLQGHVIPTVHLATKLAARGFAVTFVNTESIHHHTILSHQNTRNNNGNDNDNNDNHDDDIFAGARASGLDIRYEVVSDGLPVSFDRSLHHDQFMQAVLHVLSAHVEELLRLIVADADPPVTCLVADTFFVWPSAIAKKLGIPYVSFWTEPAIIFTLYYHMDLLINNGHFSSKEKNRTDTIMYIPGVASIEPTELMSYLQESDTSSVVHQIIFKAFEDAKGADFVLSNTVYELEPDTISALQIEKHFYAIGPIFPPGFIHSPIATSLWAESDCSHWLAAQPPRSVLYISFGSYAHVSKRDLHEIARGLLASKVRFIWVLRPDIVSSDEPDPLPGGFLEESKGRGMVVQWCSQKEVLSHPSIGGFLTHCGWNSILESIWCGVPMLCFPLLTDQFTNRKLLVKDWRIGIGIGELNSVSKEVVSKRIEELVRGKEGEEIREEVKKVKIVLESAISPNGSSTKNFDRFVSDLMNYGRKMDGDHQVNNGGHVMS
ncbi:UDP-glycosyltransferase 86A1 [Ananas comosus]|uniref:Glycosyltransferase n=1 Tax=Ananas comosus TaxID=4615 RepID=A0A199UNV5_ANACO|nr:UDP-glycosyltransferase 86A1 [Ananas comosus]